MLTGGTGRRLGGADKATLTVGSATMLDRALAVVSAVVGPDRTVVVGPRAPARSPVDFVVEDPPFGGPAAGLLAGLDRLVATSPVPPEWLVVLAVDMPFVTADTLARLFSAVGSSPSVGSGDGAVLVDGEGRAQLCAVVRRTALEGVRPDAATGLGFFRLLRDLDLVEVQAYGEESLDVDTPADLARVGELAAARAPEEAGPMSTPHPDLAPWLTELADLLGTDVALDEAVLLDLTRIVAHNVARPAGPLTTFVLGYVAARGDLDATQVAALAERIEERALAWDADRAR